MVASAAANGITLGATGTYRSYDQQANLFKQRYTTSPGTGRKKTWKGVNYWKKPKVAAAATPGRSNHGLGLAADLKAPLQHKQWLTDKELSWLASNGPSFGFWNTVESESWHWTYCLGDRVPKAVTTAEARLGLTPGKPKGSKRSAAPGAAVGFTKPLGVGSSGAEVAAVQLKLAAIGYTTETNGEFGPRTKKAVAHFQKSNGRPQNGKVDAALWQQLGLPKSGTKAGKIAAPKAPATDPPGGPTAFTKPFGSGSSGAEVAAVQAKLTAAGYTVEKNGKFGPRTKKAVAHFQKSNGRPQNGKVDAALWQLLGLG
jgi:peptidoglycan hydrolase-like protein with peptidoglycan-binding domain